MDEISIMVTMNAGTEHIPSLKKQRRIPSNTSVTHDSLNFGNPVCFLTIIIIIIVNIIIVNIIIIIIIMLLHEQLAGSRVSSIGLTVAGRLSPSARYLNS